MGFSSTASESKALHRGRPERRTGGRPRRPGRGSGGVRPPAGRPGRGRSVRRHRGPAGRRPRAHPRRERLRGVRVRGRPGGRRPGTGASTPSNGARAAGRHPGPGGRRAAARPARPLGEGTVRIGRQAGDQGCHTVRVSAHELGHIPGLPDRKPGPCSRLTSGSSAGVPCANPCPNAAERAEAEENIAEAASAGPPAPRGVPVRD
ncbi:snapalysin family zinc-dependent metalloprotease [Streptomyces sp. enrichment culture]|uniref:snapalysin family zinc-dependent metalloprotease n=1 Tax=Streptomyces sp. enrichment culture TaxID=1795815 RepID=UPI003F54EFAF